MPLPNSVVLSPDIAANGTFDTFTINTTGRYRLSYNVNTTAALIMGTRLIIAGSPSVPSTVLPLITLSSFSNELIVNITAGQTVSLQLFGLTNVVLLLSNSVGASLMITRLS